MAAAQSQVLTTGVAQTQALAVARSPLLGAREQAQALAVPRLEVWEEQGPQARTPADARSPALGAREQAQTLAAPRSHVLVTWGARADWWTLASPPGER